MTRDAVFEAGGRTDRRVRALLLVHGRNGHVLRRRGHEPDARREREGGARRGASGRDRRPRGSYPRRDRRALASRTRTRSLPTTSIRSSTVKAKLFTDGGSRGNPGPAAYAFVLEAEDGTVLDARGEAIGVATNNVAEYSALVAGLERAVEVGRRRARGRLRLGAARQADAGRVPREEPARSRISSSTRLGSRARSAASPTPRCAASTTCSPTASSTRRSTRPPERMTRMDDRHHIRIEYCVP